MRRRIPLTILSQPDTDLATAIAATVAQPFGWTPDDCAREVAHLMKHWWSP